MAELVKVLVVDDERDWADSLKDALEGEKAQSAAVSFSVQVAYDGYGAIEAVRFWAPDVVLLDLSMPGMDGLEVCRRLKKEPSGMMIPIVMLTGLTALENRVSAFRLGIDDYVAKPTEIEELVARIEMVLYRYRHMYEANPLTRLPGNIAIGREIDARIRSGQPFAVCYSDIHDFKAFNDKYGYARGDEVISQTARLFVQAVQLYGGEGDFVGHIGGDDFVLVTLPERAEELCRFITFEFDRVMPLWYAEADRETGYIEVLDRAGRPQRFPFVTILIAVISNTTRQITSSVEVATIAAELKAYLKTLSPGSKFLCDRRRTGVPTERGKGKKRGKASGARSARSEAYEGRGRPLGQMLLSAELITQAQLEEALRTQWRTGQRLAQILINMGLVKSDQVGHYLESQLGVPYVSLAGWRGERSLADLLPEDFARGRRLLPVECAAGVLSLAMVDPFDLDAIAEVEGLTKCEVRPLVAIDSELDEATNALYAAERKSPKSRR